MDTDENEVVVFIDQLDNLLLFSANIHRHQSAELTDTEIDMGHIVADLQSLQHFQRHSGLTRPSPFGRKAVFMEAVENLVVGVAANPEVIINEPLV